MKKETELSKYEKAKYDEFLEILQETSSTPFREKFYLAPFLMTSEEQEAYLKLYIEHIAGVNPKDPDLWNEVGRVLNSATDKKPLCNGATFWKGVQQSIPGFMSDEELEILIKEYPEADRAWDLISIMWLKCPRTWLIDQFISYVHVWK